MYLYVFLAACLTINGAVPLHAQTSTPDPAKDKPRSWAFSSINQVGLLSGEQNNVLQGQTINGVRYKTWFAGLGVGIDPYELKSIPLFVDVRKALLRNKNGPFLYGDAGIHLPTTRQDKDDVIVYDYKSGFYCDAGAGYRLSVATHHYLLFSAGFSSKHYRKEEGIEIQGYQHLNTYQYRLNRWSLKVGFQF